MSAPVTRLPHMGVFELVPNDEDLMWHYTELLKLARSSASWRAGA